MGQLVLLVVAAAWAAVLLPPLLRSRLENRPNSSVLDFRNQLSSLQRAVPARGVAVRSMGRSLAPSMLSRPGRRRVVPTRRTAPGSTGSSARACADVADHPPGAPRRAGCRRPRCGPASTAAAPIRGSPPGSPAAAPPRPSGAAPTSCSCSCSPPCAPASSPPPPTRRRWSTCSPCRWSPSAATSTCSSRSTSSVRRARRSSPSAPRRRRARRRRAGVADADDDDGEYWAAGTAGPRSAASDRAAVQYPPRGLRATCPAAARPGASPTAAAPSRRLRRARPARPVRPRGLRLGLRHPRDDARAPARNGRHATGQVPVQRTRRPEPADYYTNAG